MAGGSCASAICGEQELVSLLQYHWMRCNKASAPETLVLFLVGFCAFGFGFFSQGLRAQEASCSVGDARRTKRGCESNPAGPASLR